jgi:hypothetical protein
MSRPSRPDGPAMVAMSRRGLALRDAALGYVSRGIPVLPLHYPIPRPHPARPVPAGQPLGRPGWSTGCSCGDPDCGQIAKHPLGALVPHGLTQATINRARVLVWWNRYPQANIGLACGHAFDVLDLDGPQAVAALCSFADRYGVDLPAGGPVARTGRAQAGWHYYLTLAGLGRRSGVLDRVDYQAGGAYVVAPPSRHATGRPYRWVRDLNHPLPHCPNSSGPSSSDPRLGRPPRCWSMYRRPTQRGRPMCARP